MAWLDSLITGVTQLGGSLGGAAVSGSFKNREQQIANQGLYDQAVIQGNTVVGTAGWGAIGTGYATPQQLAAELGNKFQSAAQVEKARVEAEAGKNQTILIIVVVVAAAAVAFVFYMASKKA